MSTNAKRAAQAKRAQRLALRTELYERIARGDIELPEILRTMRKVMDRTQIEFARVVGVTPRTIKELERGLGNPTVETLRKILAPFDLDVGVRRRRR